MNTQVNRMQFIRADFTGKEVSIRPPWALMESLFIDTCTTCGDCITQCPSHIIKKSRANFPVIDFSYGECLFCEQCVNACKSKALIKSNTNKPWLLTASIKQDICITYQGVECRSCFDPCETNAIQMTPKQGGISIPEIMLDNCTGCGACYSICPVNAITIQ